MSDKYNGWTNQETWVMALWLHNDENMQRYWEKNAREDYNHDPTNWPWTLSNQLKAALAEPLDREGPLVWTDLLQTAISRIDWLEIAYSFEPDKG